MSEKRPSRAKMCNWLAMRLGGFILTPSNPADIQRQRELAIEGEKRIIALRHIASEMGWHADASLDYAWQLIRAYDAEHHPESHVSAFDAAIERVAATAAEMIDDALASKPDVSEEADRG